MKVGDRVVIGDGVHAGRTGIIQNIEPIFGDYGFEILLDNGVRYWFKRGEIHEDSKGPTAPPSGLPVEKFAENAKSTTPLPEPTAPTSSDLLPTDAKERKKIPLASGVLDYFESALIEVAKVSYTGNEQHNPGENLHWARGKSQDQADTMLRHFVERGKMDADGTRHSAKMAWRALAILQLELEAEGAPVARGAR